MEWVFLGMAGILEMGWAVGLKYSQGFTRLIPSLFTVFGMVASFYCLSLALKKLASGNRLCNLDRDRYGGNCGFRDCVVSRIY